jgi:hypothetical protein
MAYRLAEEIRAELAAAEGAPDVRVSGDFWPPQAGHAAHPQQAFTRPTQQQEGA